MTTISSLQTQDTALREQFANNPEAVEAAQIDALLDNVQEAGKITGGAQDRAQLVQILRHWAPIVEEKTGEHPGTKLAPYDSNANMDYAETGEEEMTVSPTEEPDEIVPSATYIQGEPQEGQPQTLAQLFMTMPTAAKVIILILIALVLAVIIFWLLSPNSDDLAVDMVGTETAVAAAITASAQPTGTNTPTATPLIYIESETSVAESAPVGSPTPIIYIIQKGDTLNKVARNYGVSVQDIVALNNIYNPNSIPIGQELLIPTPGAGTSIATTPMDAEATPIPQQTDTQSGETQQVDISNGLVSELVIRGAEPVELRIAAGVDYQSIATLPQGTFATIVAKTPDGTWFLIQLDDNFTRGWVPSENAALIYPADPNTIPTTPIP